MSKMPYVDPFAQIRDKPNPFLTREEAEDDTVKSTGPYPGQSAEDVPMTGTSQEQAREDDDDGDEEDSVTDEGGLTEEQARSLYHQYAFDVTLKENITDAIDQATKLDIMREDDWHNQWEHIVFTALLEEPSFQRVVLDQYLTPGLHDFNKLRLCKSWLMGIYLPGYYQFYDDVESGLVDDDRVATAAAIRAKETLESIIISRVERVVRGSQNNVAHGIVPFRPETTSEAVATLFALAQDEKRTNQCRADARGVLHDLQDMLQTSAAAQELSKLYGATHIRSSISFLDSETLIDRFGPHALKVLSESFEKQAPPKKMPEDAELAAHMKKASGTDSEDAIDEDFAEDNELDDDPLQDVEGLLDETAVPAVQEAFESTAEETILMDIVAKSSADHVAVYWYPFWKRLDEGVFSFTTTTDTNKPLENLPNVTAAKGGILNDRSAHVGKVARKASSFIGGRILSDMEWEQAKKGLESPDGVLQGAINSLTAPGGRMMGFERSYYQKSVEEFGAVTSRAAEAETAAHDASGFRIFSQMQMMDNWWHVRKYLQAIEYYVKIKHGKALASSAEMDLIMIFSTIRNGTNDPTPYVLVVDSVLRSFWRHLLSLVGQPAPMLKILFNELTLFSYGTAINGFVLRCKAGRQNASTITDAWYPLLRQWSSRCANIDCNRSLPEVGRISASGMRGLFSVGTRQARIGNKGFRAMISTNRDMAYPCLYTIIYCWGPNRVLVIIIFWFSHVYHNIVCKAHRGKAAITAF